MSTLNEFQQFQQDLRVWGERAALDMAALRQRVWIHKQLSVSREGESPESSRGGLAHIGQHVNPDLRPQVGPSTIHGADKLLTNMKDPLSYL